MKQHKHRPIAFGEGDIELEQELATDKHTQRKQTPVFVVRVFEFELWNQNGGKIGTIRGIAPTMKEARAIVKLIPHGCIVRNGKRIKDCYAKVYAYNS